MIFLSPVGILVALYLPRQTRVAKLLLRLRVRVAELSLKNGIGYEPQVIEFHSRTIAWSETNRLTSRAGDSCE